MSLKPTVDAGQIPPKLEYLNNHSATNQQPNNHYTDTTNLHHPYMTRKQIPRPHTKIQGRTINTDAIFFFQPPPSLIFMEPVFLERTWAPPHVRDGVARPSTCTG